MLRFESSGFKSSSCFLRLLTYIILHTKNIPFWKKISPFGFPLFLGFTPLLRKAERLAVRDLLREHYAEMKALPVPARSKASWRFGQVEESVVLVTKLT